MCTKCNRTYTHRNSLYVHMKFDCGKEPAFGCPYLGCTYKAKRKNNMVRHYKNIHKEEYPDENWYMPDFL